MKQTIDRLCHDDNKLSQDKELFKSLNALLTMSGVNKPSQEGLDEALQLAGEVNNIKCAEALLKDRSPPLSASRVALNEALKNAIKHSKPYFFKAFMEKCHISMLTDLYAINQTQWGNSQVN